MIEVGDWAAMVLTIAGVLGCVAVAATAAAARLALTVATLKAMRTPGREPVARRSRVRGLPLLGAGVVFMVGAWLAGDVLLYRARTLAPLSVGGWLELTASAALAAVAVRILLRAARTARYAGLRPLTPTEIAERFDSNQSRRSQRRREERA